MAGFKIREILEPQCVPLANAIVHSTLLAECFKDNRVPYAHMDTKRVIKERLYNSA